MTLKRQEKIGNIFFLKQDTFSTRKCMFDTFTQKFPRDYTAAYTMMFIQWLNTHRRFKRLAEALIRLRVCAG